MSVTEKKPGAILTVPEGENTIDDTLERGRYQLVLSLSPELNQRIESLANRNRMDKGELINLAVGVLDFLTNATDEGKKVGVAAPDSELETEITDL